MLAKTLYAYTIYSAALTPVILAAFYSRRVNARGGERHCRGTLVTFFWDFDVVKRHLPPCWRSETLFSAALMAALICLVVVSALHLHLRRSRWPCFSGLMGSGVFSAHYVWRVASEDREFKGWSLRGQEPIENGR